MVLVHGPQPEPRPEVGVEGSDFVRGSDVRGSGHLDKVGFAAKAGAWAARPWWSHNLEVRALEYFATSVRIGQTNWPIPG